jgi:hypothetical protein
MNMSSRLHLAALALGCLTLMACQATGTGTPYETAQKNGWQHYGAQPQSVGGYVALGALKGDEQNIVVKGRITETCTTSGCWAKIVDGSGHELIVLTEEKQFHLPRNCAGHRAVAHGNMQVREMPVAQRRHYAEVAGASAEEIAKITEPEYTLILIADSVLLDGDDFVEAYTVQQAEEACEAQLEKEINK